MFQKQFIQIRHLSTIYALSSGHGKAGVAVVRVSGPKASKVLLNLTRRKNLPPPKMARLQTLFDRTESEEQEVIDRALTLWFPGPASFTGEDTVEFHCHGSVAVLKALFKALSKSEGLRHAEAGEFTKRAFYNGKLDLTQVEALADLIHSETEMQRKVALRNSGENSSLKEKFVLWRGQVLKIISRIEAFIDFSESDDLETDVLSEAVEQVNLLRLELESHVKDARAGERLRDGVRIAIVGEPNAGKSSLINLLAQRDVSIVSSIAGTTRDVLESKLDLGGYPAVILDTAGLRDRSEDSIEVEGIARAKRIASAADLVIHVIDSEKRKKATSGPRTNSEQFELNFLDENVKRIVVYNKVDLLSEDERRIILNEAESEDCVNVISCTSKEGSEIFIQKLSGAVKDLCSAGSSENALITRHRQREHVDNAARNLGHFLTSLNGPYQTDVAASCQYLRMAVKDIERLSPDIGRISSEQILDVIFADFCIGK